MVAMSWFKKSLLALLVTGIAGIAGIALFSPHVFVLLGEGYPAKTWPSGGEFAKIAGDETGLANPRIQGDFSMVKLTSDITASAILVGAGNRDTYHLFLKRTNEQTRFNSFSLVKGLVGFLALRAVDEGRIHSLDSTVAEISPGLSQGAVAGVTLRELLDMRSGISFEPYGMKAASGTDEAGEKPVEAVPYNPFGPLARLHVMGIEKTVRDFRVSAHRRGKFEYQNANTALVGHLLETAFAEPLPQTLSRLVWKPSGAANADWRVYPGTNTVSAYCCLYATAPDWRRVAQFLLRNGNRDAPLLSVAMHAYWMGSDLSVQQRHKGVYRSFARYDILDREGEKVQGPFHYFLGQNGQIVYFLPEKNAVAIRFGDGIALLHSGLYALADKLQDQSPGQ